MPHIHEKIDFTAEVFIVHDNKVLLRMHDKYNIWLGVGGHIELDEDPNLAAIREVKEEVGLDIQLFAPKSHIQIDTESYKELIPPVFMNIHKVNEDHKHVSLYFFAKSQTDQLKPRAEEADVQCRWFTAQDLDNPEFKISQPIIIYAKAALKELAS